MPFRVATLHKSMKALWCEPREIVNVSLLE